MTDPTTFSGQADEKLRDDKWSSRVDGNSSAWGNLSAYYFFDDYYLSIIHFPAGRAAQPFLVLTA